MATRTWGGRDKFTVNFAGTLLRDADMSYMQDGGAVFKFSLPSHTYTKKDEKDTWVNFVYWVNVGKDGTTEFTNSQGIKEDRVEIFKSLLRKGNIVAGEGDLSYRTFSKRDGSEGTSVEVTIRRFMVSGEAAVAEYEPETSAADHM